MLERRESTKFNLFYANKYFPPKYVISLANLFANSEEYPSSEFSGGEESNRFLKALGFTIMRNGDNNTNAEGEKSLSQIANIPFLGNIKLALRK